MAKARAKKAVKKIEKKPVEDEVQAPKRQIAQWKMHARTLEQRLSNAQARVMQLEAQMRQREEKIVAFVQKEQLEKKLAELNKQVELCVQKHTPCEPDFRSLIAEELLESQGKDADPADEKWNDLIVDPDGNTHVIKNL